MKIQDLPLYVSSLCKLAVMTGRDPQDVLQEKLADAAKLTEPSTNLDGGES